MSNYLQTNFGYFMITVYDTYLLCHLVDIFFTSCMGAKELKNNDERLQCNACLVATT